MVDFQLDSSRPYLRSLNSLLQPDLSHLFNRRYRQTCALLSQSLQRSTRLGNDPSVGQLRTSVYLDSVSKQKLGTWDTPGTMARAN